MMLFCTYSPVNDCNPQAQVSAELLNVFDEVHVSFRACSAEGVLLQWQIAWASNA